MKKNKKHILAAVSTVVVGMACLSAYTYHKGSEGAQCSLRLRGYDQLVRSCGVDATENVPGNWKSPEATEAMVLRIFKQRLPACPAGGAVSLVHGRSADGEFMPSAICSLENSHGHFDPANGKPTPNKASHSNRH